MQTLMKPAESRPEQGGSLCRGLADGQVKKPVLCASQWRSDAVTGFGEPYAPQISGALARHVGRPVAINQYCSPLARVF